MENELPLINNLPLLHIENYFASHLGFFVNTDLISDLKKYILSLPIEGIDSNCNPLNKKNLKESSFDFFVPKEQIIERTTNFISTALAGLLNELQKEKCSYQFKFNESWYHIGKTNSTHEPHSHPNCSWCGVYYIDVGDGNSGETIFLNPFYPNYRDHGTKYLEEEAQVKINVQNGLLVLFPSHLHHFQSLYVGSKDRIVVAFNIAVLNSSIHDKRSN